MYYKFGYRVAFVASTERIFVGAYSAVRQFLQCRWVRRQSERTPQSSFVEFSALADARETVPPRYGKPNATLRRHYHHRSTGEGGVGGIP